jgi:hypothetical protein
VAVRIDVNDRVYFDVFETGLTEEAMHAAADEKINAVAGRIPLEDLKETIPGAKRRFAKVRKIVCLVAGDDAAWTGEPDHLLNDRFGVRHIYKE